MNQETNGGGRGGKGVVKLVNYSETETVLETTIYNAACKYISTRRFKSSSDILNDTLSQHDQLTAAVMGSACFSCFSSLAMAAFLKG